MVRAVPMNIADQPPEKKRSALFLPEEEWVKALSGRLICIRTFGCAYNVGDSDLLATVLTASGSVIVSDPDLAEVMIINTCIVIASTERKMQKEISSYPDHEVYVTGCLPLALPESLQSHTTVKLIHPDSIHRAAATVPHDQKGPVSVVQIGPGCVGSCRYCITRCARGSIRSNPPQQIHSHIARCAWGGAVEIRLAGQDLSAYGHDTGQWSLATLLEGMPALPDTSRIRLGMMNPATLKPIAQEVARAMKNGPFFSFLHLPIQSGSDHVLDLMGRGYTVADVQNIIDIFRAEMPDITIATDIITGFPGETDDDHEETVRLIRRIAPGMVNVTRYSWRPGTGMSRDHELPDRIRKDRSRVIIRESYTMFQKVNEKKRGAVMTVIPTEQLKPGSVMARSERYEGVVIREECQLGIPCMVTITGSTPHYLIGEVVRD